MTVRDRLKLGTAIVISAFVLATTFEATPAAAEDQASFFYNMTEDDSWTTGMALAQASVAASRGHSVTVFLNIRAVNLANQNAIQSPWGPSGKTPAQAIATLIADGHTVLICGGCMKVAGLSADDLIDGVQIANPDLTFGAMTAPETIVISY